MRHPTLSCGLLLALAASVFAQGEASQPQDRRINEGQWIGTHNSYHIAPDEYAMQLIAKTAPAEALALDYTRRSLTEQLNELGMRHFELDLYRDPEGKLYRQPAALRLARQAEVEVPEFDPEQRLQQPGIKVLHSPDIDFRTTNYTLADALQEIRDWSLAHPNHEPLFLLLELKSDSYSPFTRPLAWDEAGFQTLEKAILSVFPRESLLTPDDIRNNRPTLRAAVYDRGWPTLAESRGKIILLMDNEGAERDAYLEPSEILANRLLFVSVAPDHPAAAWMKRNDPVGSFADIQSLVAHGFLVRTRADSGTAEARANDTTRRDRAIASGAQLISTDYPTPDRRFSDYHVTLPPPSAKTAPR